MQLSVFNTDQHKSGFRLQYLQVLNWGTFDGEIYTIAPGGETCLLTGANSSGKTTIIDALLTLMVPESRYRFYNQSSGSNRKNYRTEASYLLGEFGEIGNEDSSAVEKEYLRPDKERAYSVLLAHFANEEMQSVTLFQARHYQSDEMKKFYGITHIPLRIEDDVTPFDLSGNWKRNLEQRYSKNSRRQIEWFGGASQYAQRLVEVLGLQSTQALQLFNHTVGIKVLDNLDEFIRSNMLEQRTDAEDEFIGLKKQLSELLNAQQKMEKAEVQIGLLKPLADQHVQAEALSVDISKKKAAVSTAALWKGFTKNQLLAAAIADESALLRSLQSELETFKITIQGLGEEERKLQNEIEGSKEGQRLKELEKDLAVKTIAQSKAQQAKDKLKDYCKEVSIDLPEILDEIRYKQLKQEAQRRVKTIADVKRADDEERFAARDKKQRSEEQQAAIEQQLASMQQGQNNMDFRVAGMRKRICEALNIPMTELPFAGELMRVADEHIRWEHALEMLLGGFARRMLVPEKHYKRVNKYVNNTDLRGKLTYELAIESALNQMAEEGTAPDKLEFHPDHTLSHWVGNQVILRYRVACIEDEKGIEKYPRAVTLAGLIKEGARHTKDDRPGNTQNYVMGWSNEKKKAMLIAQRSTVLETIRVSDEVIGRCTKREGRFTQELFACNYITTHDGFETVNTVAIAKSIQKLTEQISQLRQSSAALKALGEQLADVRSRKSTAEEVREKLVGREALCKNRLEQFNTVLEQLKPLLINLTEADKDDLIVFQQQQADMLAEASLNNLDALYDDFKQKLSEEIERLGKNHRAAELKITEQINRIKNPTEHILRFPDWAADVVLLPNEAEYVADYVEWLDKLVKEDLPKYRREFESFINTTITHKVASLNTTLLKWESDIEGHVKSLNESLAGIIFNRLPDTFIQLSKRKMSAGSAVKEFRQQLLEALPQATNWQQESFEAKAAHFTEKVLPLINKLEQEQYRKSMLDVRNWFEFWADERYCSNRELKKTYRQMGHLSGGEKAQVTYTILCSAIAYQFGITRKTKTNKSLRFIAVDESFSNQDEEKSTYLMDLCRELHLQLLVVTPNDKVHIVQDYIAHVHFTQRPAARNSTLYNMTIKEFKAQMEAADNDVAEMN